MGEDCIGALEHGLPATFGMCLFKVTACNVVFAVKVFENLNPYTNIVSCEPNLVKGSETCTIEDETFLNFLISQQI